MGVPGCVCPLCVRSPRCVMSSSFFKPSLTFWYNQMFSAHLLLSLPQPWNQSFLQGALLSFCGEWYPGTMSWVLGLLIAPRVSLLAVPLSRRICIQVSIFISVPIKNYQVILIPSIPVYHYFLVFCFFIFVTPSTERNLATIFLSIICSRLECVKGSFRMANSYYCGKKKKKT